MKKISFVLVLFFFTVLSCQKELPAVIKVRTLPAADIMATSASLEGQIIDVGEGITDHGHCWAEHSNPQKSDFSTSFGSSAKTGSFYSEIEDLKHDTRYYFRCWAVGHDGEVKYGEVENFTTSDGKASISTSEVTDITACSAVSGGSITSVSGSEVEGRGVIWHTVDPFGFDVNSGITSDGSGTGSFVSDLSDLEADMLYYIKSYAITGVDTSYGDIKSFTTMDGRADITTAEVTDIELYSATSGGNITSAGGSEVIKRGVCWSTEEDPTVYDSKTEDGPGLGEFTSSLSGLTHATDYYLKAYAITKVDTTYGSVVSFSTNDGIIDLTTSSVTNITATSATSGGTISDDGGSNVTARGVCWSTFQNPTVADNKTSDGGGTGSYTSEITGLTEGADYYVRAYATNSVGTAYGNQISLNTRDVLNPTTGKTWMNRNLGASRVATSGTDAEAYGNLYQWGRAVDGHEKRDSPVTSVLSGSDTPGHGNFIIVGSYPFDWRSPQNDNLWQGVNGTNNPCPVGFRLPTAAEWEAERQSWSSNNSAGAFASPLKLPMAGYRDFTSGSLSYVGSYGYYWSSTVDGGAYSQTLYFLSSSASIFTDFRGAGASVRCIKD